MNPWKPDADPAQARRIGKTGEEVNELGAVLFRISIQGLNEIDPSSGKSNRQRLVEETADVLAQIYCNTRSLFTPEEVDTIYQRAAAKAGQMKQWEAHFKEQP